MPLRSQIKVMLCPVSISSTFMSETGWYWPQIWGSHRLCWNEKKSTDSYRNMQQAKAKLLQDLQDSDGYGPVAGTPALEQRASPRGVAIVGGEGTGMDFGEHP